MQHNDIVPEYSVIVPVYNRIDEVRDLLESLAAQSDDGPTFEVILVEDGSTEPCREVAETYSGRVDVHYYFKENEGRSIARNYGIERSRGQWLIFFDSDCVIPDGYFCRLGNALKANPEVDCFGGPDAAHSSFTPTQKAINFAMTSFLTTGGIRGGRVSMEKFVPRTFNMGFRREVYDRVGGFREMFSEDIDMSMRIAGAGYRTMLVRDAAVYHKRRVDFRKFFRQVYVFGQSRITLHHLYPGSMKPVHVLPAVAVIIGVMLLVLGVAVSWWFLLPAGLYLLALFVAALASTRSVGIALRAVPAGVIQICGYGLGFIRAFVPQVMMGRGRDVAREVALRKGR